MLATNPEKGWIMSRKSVKDFNSIPGRILSPVFGQKSNKELFHMFYNDEHPDGNTSFTLGHTKGALVFSKDMGFWLVHSVPKYPPSMNNAYDYPHTGQMYGQSFLCISLSTKASADKIATQLMFNHPYIYSTYIPKWTVKNYPILTQVAMGNRFKKPFQSIGKFKSLGGLEFTSFAKTELFGQDLYDTLVAPTLKQALKVETWPNGRGKMNSSCNATYHVVNIDGIDFKSKPDVKFTTHKDHAKWAVTSGLKMADKDKYVCIGDINRMETQKKRGGGTVCFQNKDAWANFNKIISNDEPCPKKPKH